MKDNKEVSYISRKYNIIYNGFPKKLSDLIFKWFIYTFSNSKAGIIKDQKLIYLFLFISIIVFLAYRWNYFYGYNDGKTNPLFIPHITKIIFFFSSGLYFLFRGLVKPLYVGENVSFLLPFRWLLIGIIGIFLDIVKAPGLIWGSILLLYKRVTNLFTNIYKLN